MIVRTLLLLAACPAVFCLEARDAEADEELAVEYRFIPDPVPETFEEVLGHVAQSAIGGNASKLVPVKEHGLLGGRDVTIMGYPAEEDGEVSRQLGQSGGEWETHHMSDLCDPWQVAGGRGHFLDVGANIGTYTLPMADCIRGKGSVISIEGMPSIADHLRAGIVNNKAENVVLYSYAVGGKTGANEVRMQLNSTNKGGSSVIGNKPKESGLEEVVVRLTNLDSILHRDPRMRALLSAKVDIEGNEGRMLRGAQQLFSKYPPCYLMIELIPQWLDSTGFHIEDIVPTLHSYGYEHVPSAKFLRHSRWRAKTIHASQKDMEGCKQRVASEYAGGS